MTISRDEFESLRSGLEEVKELLKELTNPNTGLYAKISEKDVLISKLGSRLKALEDFKETVEKIVWRILTPVFSLMGLAMVYLLYKAMIGGLK